jgi:tetraacyldisaccharide 4'-kinase
MNRALPQFKLILFPLSLLYRLAVAIRNWMFDTGILTSKKYDIPVISIGNITVGGTGKTPHTEYLISLLSPFMKVAMLSRGYKRHTKGFVLADAQSDSLSIGDEPYQIKRKFKDAIIAVDGNRRRGIESLLSSVHGKELGAIVLDDAYQHRYVEPGISILLTDYNRLITNDYFLPVGNLREPANNKKRANIVIVTKCPESAQPIDFRIVTKDLSLLPYQNLYFTKYKYGELKPVFELDVVLPVKKELLLKEEYDILLFTGIVSQQYIAEYLLGYTKNLQTIEYSDHYNFLPKDLLDIEKQFESINGSKKIIITTEKDASRLLSNPNVSDVIKESLYYLPIEVVFLFGHEKDFNEQILGYVRKNKTNRGLFKK